jgi:hypothetical protein
MYKIYLSGALTGISQPEKVKQFYEGIGLVCTNLNLIPYIPHTVSDPILNHDLHPTEVFELDKNRVIQSDLVIAYLGLPSLGVGMELAYAESYSIPIILLYEDGKLISRLARGIPTIIAEICFKGKKDAFDKLEIVLRDFLRSK